MTSNTVTKQLMTELMSEFWTLQTEELLDFEKWDIVEDLTDDKLDSLLKVINEVKDEQTNIASSLTEVQTKVVEIKVMLQTHDRDITKCMKDLKSFTDDNINFLHEIQELKIQVHGFNRSETANKEAHYASQQQAAWSKDGDGWNKDGVPPRVREPFNVHVKNELMYRSASMQWLMERFIRNRTAMEELMHQYWDKWGRMGSPWFLVNPPLLHSHHEAWLIERNLRSRYNWLHGIRPKHHGLKEN